MQEPNKHPNESEHETLADCSENSIQYLKYIQKLELQRSVLNKILETDFNTTIETTSIDTGISESV